MRKLLISGIIGFTVSVLGCSEDSVKDPITICGNGTLDSDEICDGSIFANHVKVCPEGLVLKDESAFACTSTCGVDFSRACAAPSCGDGVLSGGEVCDGELFRDGVKVCPAGMTLLPHPEFKCTEICMVDYRNACTVESAICGDGKLDEVEICDGSLFQSESKRCPGDMIELAQPVYGCTDKCQIDYTNACISSICGDGKLTGAEICDGELFADGAKVCPEGKQPLTDRDLFSCNACLLDTSKACVPNDVNPPILYVSEISLLKESHLYIEIGNLGAKTTLDGCKLAGVNLDNDDIHKISYIFEYDLAQVIDSLANTAAEPTSVLGICYETTEGWLKKQFNDESMTENECNAFYKGAMAAYSSCYDYCENTENINQNECIGNCSQLFQNTYSAYADCISVANYMRLNELCKYYIPSTETSLGMLWNANNDNSLWGIALVCGNTIHDLIKLNGFNFHGGERWCKIDSDLSSIVATGDQIIKSGYQANNNSSVFNTNDDPPSYGYARCAEVFVW